MAEKKEKQWAVVKLFLGRILSIVWFDSRSEARAYELKKRKGILARTTKQGTQYLIKPMTRGPRA